jgi:hypothetical protein
MRARPVGRIRGRRGAGQAAELARAAGSELLHVHTSCVVAKLVGGIIERLLTIADIPHTLRRISKEANTAELNFLEEMRAS